MVSKAIQGLPANQILAINNIIFNIRSFLSFFLFWLVSHVCRDFNFVIHSIAR